EVYRVNQEIRDALVALVLEMVLRQPERVVAEVVHGPRERFGLLEHRGEVVVGITPLVGRRGVLPHVAEIDVPRIERRELGDHKRAPLVPGRMLSAQTSSHPFELSTYLPAVLDLCLVDPAAAATV